MQDELKLYDYKRNVNIGLFNIETKVCIRWIIKQIKLTDKIKLKFVSGT